MILLVVLAVARAQQDPGTPLVVGSEVDYPPFALGQTDETASGFTVALWQAVATASGLHSTIRVRPFQQLLDEFQRGKIDVMINLAQSEERRAFADFSVPHVIVHGAVFVRTDELRIRSEADLAGKSILVLHSDLAHDYAVTKGWEQQLMLVQTAADGLKLLASGRHDAMLLSRLAGMQTLRGLKLRNVKALEAKAGFAQRFAFAVPKGRSDLLATINEGLAFVKATGTYDALYEQWFGVFEVRAVDWRRILPYLGPIAVACLVGAGFVLLRQRERRKGVEALRSSHASLAQQIAERRHAEQALSASEQRYRTIVETAHEGICVLDAQGDTTFVNRRMGELLGYTPEEMIGRNLLAFIDASGRDEAARNLARRAQGLTEEHECCFVRRDGAALWTICATSPMYDDREQCVGAVGMILDITARKQAEEQMRETNAMLASVAQMQRQCLVEADPRQWFDQMLTLLLERTASAYGFIGEILRQPSGQPYLKSLALTNFAWSDATRAFYEQHDQTGLEFSNLQTLFGEVITRRTTVIANDPTHDPRRGGLPPGHPPLHAFLGIPFFHGDDMTSMVGLANRAGGYDDRLVQSLAPLLATCASLVLAYTLERQRRHAEAERRRLEEHLYQAQKLESLGILAGGIAHDFNNLLTSILGYADLALHELPPETSARPFIGEVMHGARRAAELTKQMLAYSGKGHFVVEPLNLSALTEEMIRLLHLSISKKCVLQCNLMPDLPTVDADAAQVRQVLMNLIINASEAIGDRSGVIAVTTGVMHCDRAYLAETSLDASLAEGVYAYLEVADTGSGMAEATRAHIFDPFFTTKFTGRGLGLSAVLGIVRGHRGAIKCDSEPGKGTTFKVLLPITAVPVPTSAPHAPRDQAWRGRGTVLVVDDEASVRALTQQMLERMGFTVLTAADGREGVDVFRAAHERIRGVLLDMTMPHLDGEETFRELRRLRDTVRTILMSGYNEQTATSRFAGKGLAGFIQKPFHFEALRTVVREAFGNESAGTL